MTVQFPENSGLDNALRMELSNVRRRARTDPPSYIIIHSTRGPASGNQFWGTINWFQSKQSEQGTWGPAADMVIGKDGTIALFTDEDDRDFRETRANWSAGYGTSTHTTFGADEYGVSIELAQSASLEDFTPETLETLAHVLAALHKMYKIPLERIGHLTQLRTTMQRGVVGHEDTENGRKTGKSDPGSKFPWDAVLLRAKVLSGEVTQNKPLPAWVGAPEQWQKLVTEAANGRIRPVRWDGSTPVYEFDG